MAKASPSKHSFSLQLKLEQLKIGELITINCQEIKIVYREFNPIGIYTDLPPALAGGILRIAYQALAKIYIYEYLSIKTLF